LSFWKSYGGLPLGSSSETSSISALVSSSFTNLGKYWVILNIFAIVALPSTLKRDWKWFLPIVVNTSDFRVPSSEFWLPNLELFWEHVHFVFWASGFSTLGAWSIPRLLTPDFFWVTKSGLILLWPFRRRTFQCWARDLPRRVLTSDSRFSLGLP